MYTVSYHHNTSNNTSLINFTVCALSYHVGTFSASDILDKYEYEFFEVVEPRMWLRRLVRTGVITHDVKSHIEVASVDDAREILYEHLKHNANVDTLKQYCELIMIADGYPRMQVLGRKMMEELPLEGWLS